jgi:SWI/SNF-related matrix-associated actin-dependent regulator 1 of chromatin subfamily A
LAESDFANYLYEIKDKNNREIDSAMRAKQLTLLNELRQITTKGKIEAAKEVIQNIIDGDEKVIVFSCYNEPLEKLHEFFKDNSVIITGQTPDIFRKSAIESFQNDKNTKIFFGGMKSSSAGITLTEGSSVVFIDFSWTPADHDQAVARADRIGQKAEKVTIYQLYAEGTIDEKMKNILTEKREIFNQLIESNNIVSPDINKNNSIIDDLIKKYKK